MQFRIKKSYIFLHVPFFIVLLQRFLNHEALFLYTFLQYIAMATSLRPANYCTVITLHLWWLTARSAILSKKVKQSIVFLPPIGFCSNNHFSNWRRHLCQFFYSVISICQRSFDASFKCASALSFPLTRPSFTRSFLHSPVHSFNRSFLHSPVHSFIHSFILTPYTVHHQWLTLNDPLIWATEAHFPHSLLPPFLPSFAFLPFLAYFFALQR